MKPIILTRDKDNHFDIDEKKLQEIIDTAYNAGYEDGQKNQQITVPAYPTTTQPYYNWATDPTVSTCKTEDLKTAL